MTEEAVTHGKSIISFTDPGQGALHLGQAMEASTVLGGMFPGGLLGSSGIPITPGLEYDERLYTQQQIITAQQEVIATQYQEIRRLQQLANSMSQELESAANAATESDEDLELDYSDMEAQAHPEIRPDVNWKATPKIKTYAELFDSQDEISAEDT